MAGIQVLPPALLFSLSSASRPPPTPTMLPSAWSPLGPDLGARPLLPLQKIQRAHQEALLQKTWNSRLILKYMDKFREVSGQQRWSSPLC